MRVSRRTFVRTAPAIGAFAAMDGRRAEAQPASGELPASVRALKAFPGRAVSITDEERRARIENARRLMTENEKAAHAAAFKAAQVGATCESVDAAARKVITDAGFGPDYKVPGLPHRTGHGIGMDGHEWTNFVRGNKTRIAPGMCFSDEPMIAVYGEFGIRLEDCLHITESGAKFFTGPATGIDRLFG